VQIIELDDTVVELRIQQNGHVDYEELQHVQREPHEHDLPLERLVKVFYYKLDHFVIVNFCFVGLQNLRHELAALKLVDDPIDLEALDFDHVVLA
jgi:hypothetical protein